jgi:cytochrome c2
MKDLRIHFAVTSALMLVLLMASPLKDYFVEWRSSQQDFNAYLDTLPVRLKPVSIELRQQWIEDLDRADRCVSCHLGVSKMELKDAPHPWRTHSPMYHRIEEMGCTICHAGHGEALTNDGSKGRVKHAETPMLPIEYTESACGVCHAEMEVPEAPLLSQGKGLIKELNCAGCHQVPVEERRYMPPLDGIGRKTTRSWLRQWLTNPRSMRPDTPMPYFPMSAEEVNILTEFLLSFQELPPGVTLPDTTTMAALAQTEKINEKEAPPTGESLFNKARCVSCHTVVGEGGGLVVEIGDVGSKIHTEWLYAYLRSPRTLMRDVPMPQYGFSLRELYEVTKYIRDVMQLPSGLQSRVARSGAVPEADIQQKGLELFEYYNCAGCHALGDIKGNRTMGPDLSDVGSKPLYQFDFGTKDIPQTRHDYLNEKLQDPRGFFDKARMPDYRLDAQAMNAITVALMSFQDVALPDARRAPQPQPVGFTAQGAAGRLLDNYACLHCHRVFDRGGTAGPDITRSGSQLQEQWMKDYFVVPASHRPAGRIRMPNLIMPQEDIDITTEYILTVFRDDSIDVIMTDEGTEEEAQTGAILYDRLGCRACHQLGRTRGTVGPSLDNVGSRVKTGWIYQWLKNPQQYIPDTTEPNRDLTHEELRALSAYLSRQKAASESTEE